MINIDIGQM